jgi:hypothetical protein
MKRIVADYLASRLCPDAILVSCAIVSADALDLLRTGMISDVEYRRGRLLGEVSRWDLLAGGHVELLRRWAAAEPRPQPLHRVLLGGAVGRADLEALDYMGCLELALVQRCLGHDVTPSDVAALEARAITDSERWWLRQLTAILGSPAGAHRRALTDEPIHAVGGDLEDEHRLDLYSYVRTGDHAGCLRLLGTAVARAKDLEQAGTRFESWPRLARMCRFLTGDDAAAMGLLEHVPLPGSHDDWLELFGPLGAARIQRAKDAVLTVIERAFDGIEFPGPAHHSLFQAEAIDSYRGCDQSRDHKGRWQDLPRDHLLACQFALPHLRAESLPYYLPAILSFVVREHDREPPGGAGWIFEAVAHHLRFSLHDPAMRDHHAERHRLLTRDQLAAIAAFADYYGHRCSPDDRARWHDLARGGRW